MRILSITLKNLHSLKGLHEIDLTRPSFVDSGLFLITGPTGAGKSTILDALTLALYGKAPRYAHGQTKEILSKGEKEGFAEVTFQVKDKIYRSRWELQKRVKRTGEEEFEPAKMRIAVVTPSDSLLPGEEDITPEGKSSLVEKKIEALTGLNYERFLRSVMLAQGQFAAFLKAKSKEKTELLSQISGVDIFKRLSMEAYRIYNDEIKAHYLNLEAKIKTLKEENPSSLEALKAELELQENEILKLGKKKNKVETKVRLLEELEKLGQKSRLLQDEIQQLMEKTDTIKALETQLARSNEAFKAKALLNLNTIETIERELQSQAKNIAALKNKITENSLQLELLHKEQTETLDKAQALERKKNLQLPLIEEAMVWDVKIQAQRTEYQNVKKSYEAQRQELEKKQAQTLAWQNEYDKQTATLSSLDDALAKDPSNSILHEQMPALQEIYNLYLKAQTRQTELTESKASEAQKLSALRERQAQLGQDLQLAEQQLAEKSDIIRNLKAQITEYTAGSDILDFRDSLSAQEKVCQKGRDMLRIAQQYRQLEQDLQNIKQLKETQDNEFLALNLDLEKTRNELSVSYQEAQASEKNYEQSLKIASYEADRARLRPGENCPLCGSTEHPWATALDIEPSAIETLRNFWRNKVATLQAAFEELNMKSQKLQVQIQNNENQLTQKNAALQSLYQEYQENLQALALETSDISAEYWQTWLENEQECLKALQEKNHKITIANIDLKKSELELEELANRNSLLKNKQHELELDSKACQGRLEIILKDWEAAQKEFNYQKERLEQAITPYVLLDKPLAELMKLLQARSQKYEQLLNEREAAAQKQAQIQNQLNIEQAALQEKQNNLALLENEVREKHLTLTEQKEKRKQIWESDTPAEDKKALLQQEEAMQQIIKRQEQALARLGAENAEKRSQLEKEDNRLQTLEAQLLELKHKAQDTLNKFHFETLEELEATLLEDSEKKQIEKKIEDFYSHLQTQKGLWEQTQNEYNAVLKQAYIAGCTVDRPSEALLTLKEEKSALEAQIEKWHAQKGVTMALIKQQKRVQSEIEMYNQELSALKPRFEAWGAICDVIGERQGTKFEKFVQQITLEYLCQHANRYLAELNPRYRLQRDRQEQTDLELEIIDLYQAENTRPTSSLSGGETFLLSLALSLALSDLGGSKMRIETLFIDEGFGTLDSDTLDSAIQTLENLHYGGKTVGLITHVEELKERIHTQINIHPLAGGVSRVSIKE